MSLLVDVFVFVFADVLVDVLVLVHVLVDVVGYSFWLRPCRAVSLWSNALYE